MELQPTKPGDPSVGCSAWMHLVPDTLPIHELAVPGTHNSACVQPKGFHVAWPWARCQGSTLQAQLHMGVRYFDLRLADTFDDDIYVTHKLFGATHGGRGSSCVFSRSAPFGVFDCMYQKGLGSSQTMEAVQ
eukprot:TRINITY_DN17049_c0_g1_i1.p1 TRINITY_DN17049_c0_g1~~TRINITY_DN17049_c0_g1_i1.p1  ORF type:complete len:132 (+),score=13.46 TRINITY_DN17049_c0_g1_i1:199-594(+)